MKYFFNAMPSGEADPRCTASIPGEAQSIEEARAMGQHEARSDMLLAPLFKIESKSEPKAFDDEWWAYLEDAWVQVKPPGEWTDSRPAIL